jgi:myosin-1
MEAFGNAKTIRNDNSSRFGKYLEIQFNENNAPIGGQITTFLLEKTRVAFQGKRERNFHIFYDLCAGADAATREDLGLGNDPTYFYYLAQSGCTSVEGVDDRSEFEEVKKAMQTVGITGNDQANIWKILAAILWLGQIRFTGNAPAHVQDKGPLDYAAYLLQIAPEILEQALNHKRIQSGSARATQYQVPQNADQSDAIRDALGKTLYSRIFDYLVVKVNASMRCNRDTKVIGVLDIYGFEVFQQNSFEQFCINYVNERLQQIFIELTVRGEQEEYREEGMKWKDIKFFDNKIVCELIEGSRPPGIFRVLDDVCRSVHAGDQDTTDAKFMEKLMTLQHPHLSQHPGSRQFTVKHYAGDVTYDVAQFAFKNKDTLFPGLIMAMQESANHWIKALFPEDVQDDKRAPTTAGYKLRTSAQFLVERLSRCHPHYVRCIKSNDKKAPLNFNSSRVEHQVKYLGLLENIKVKRSGYAYRQQKNVFLRRYAVIATKRDEDPKPSTISELIQWLKSHVSDVDTSEFEEGKTKIFIKTPETIFLLEELLYKRTDPEGYKLKVQEYKERQKIAAQQARQGRYQRKCIIS